MRCMQTTLAICCLSKKLLTSYLICFSFAFSKLSRGHVKKSWAHWTKTEGVACAQHGDSYVVGSMFGSMMFSTHATHARNPKPRPRKDPEQGCPKWPHHSVPPVYPPPSCPPNRITTHRHPGRRPPEQGCPKWPHHSHRSESDRCEWCGHLGHPCLAVPPVYPPPSWPPNRITTHRHPGRRPHLHPPRGVGKILEIVTIPPSPRVPPSLVCHSHFLLLPFFNFIKRSSWSGFHILPVPLKIHFCYTPKTRIPRNIPRIPPNTSEYPTRHSRIPPEKHLKDQFKRAQFRVQAV